jgi:hypothetical protein
MGSSEDREPLAGNAQEHTYNSEGETGNQLPSSVDVLSVGPLPSRLDWAWRRTMTSLLPS